MSDLYFRQEAVGEMANFAYLLGSRSTRRALVVDPAWNVDGLLDAAESEGVEVVGALVTHWHPDHVGGPLMGHDVQGLTKLLEVNPCPIHVHKADARV